MVVHSVCNMARQLVFPEMLGPLVAIERLGFVIINARQTLLEPVFIQRGPDAGV